MSDEDKAVYEDTFEFEDGKLPERIDSAALNTWVFNEDTIKQVLHVLMRDGLKVDYGQKIGKTIIFAKNHDHAEKILEVFNKQYPELSKNGQPFAKVIDNYMTYAQSAIDEFSDADKMPQIAISVDMLDTGIDVPEVLNLVFFKKVMSKAKFWQMIGRGTRLCPGLIDGEDKDKFYIFDFCGNFEFFRMNQGRPTANSEMEEIISECPYLKIAIGHFGMVTKPDWKKQIMLARHKNVMIESGGITWLFNDEFYPFRSAVRAINEAADLVGFEKLMWGSDYPRTITAITYKMSYDFVIKSKELEERSKKLFLGENAKAFYGFKNLPELPYIKNMSE